MKFNHLLAFLQQGEGSFFLKNAHFCATNNEMFFFMIPRLRHNDSLISQMTQSPNLCQDNLPTRTVVVVVVVVDQN